MSEKILLIFFLIIMLAVDADSQIIEPPPPIDWDNLDSAFIEGRKYYIYPERLIWDEYNYRINYDEMKDGGYIINDFIDTNSIIMIIYMKNHKIDTSTYFQKNSKKFQKIYISSEFDGSVHESYYKNKLTSREHYINGTFYTTEAFDTLGNYMVKDSNGTKIGYYDNGNMQFKVEYKSGLKNGIFERWYENGNKEVYEQYLDGQIIDYSKKCFENGQIKSLKKYKDGKLSGRYKEWYENGKLKEKSNYLDGVYDGKKITYDENGKKLKQHYTHGDLRPNLNKKKLKKDKNTLYVFYNKNQTKLNINNRKKIVEFIANNPPDSNIIYYVDAHCDINETNTDTLSMYRAKEVVELMIKTGVSPNQIIPKGYGCRAPVSKFSIKKDQYLSNKKNRRQKIEVINRNN